MVLILFWFWFWGKWVSIWDNCRHHLDELGTWGSTVLCGLMDFVNKDLVSRVSPQSLRNLIWACPSFSNKKQVRTPWSPCESPLGSCGFKPLGSDLLSSRWFSNLWRLRNLTHEWSHSSLLFLTCLRNLVGTNGQTSETGSHFVFSSPSLKAPQWIFANDHIDDVPTISNGGVLWRYRMSVVPVLV